MEIKIHVTYSGGAFKIEMVEILMTEHPIKLRSFDKKAPIFLRNLKKVSTFYVFFY